MNTYKALIQYKGTGYLGWQIQPEGKTVQGELNKALVKISKSNDIKSMGSGRTDRGVHALGQVVRMITPLSIGNEELKRALNSLLPSDIQVLQVEPVSEEFNPVKDAKSKEYVYLFSKTRRPSVFHHEYVAGSPGELNFNSMSKACALFVGRHDFSDFQCVGTEVSTTVREIFECEISEFNNDWGIFPDSEELLMLRVVGEGFLKQMVRLMVGTLWSVGLEKCTLEQLKSSLDAPSGQKLGIVAPPEGLYLKQVFYS